MCDDGSTAWYSVGKGLLIAMTVPALLPSDSLPGVVNALNLLLPLA
jgi:hypothetical protein